tara:strand:+ start:275 stop:466 length:192 start_codon:yes stop_codon:yes gene_type:complete
MVNSVVSELDTGVEFTAKYILEVLYDQSLKHYIPTTHFIGYVLGQRKDVVRKGGKSSSVWVKK